MPVYKNIKGNGWQVVVWNVTESVEELARMANYSGEKPVSNRRYTERLATYALLNVLGFKFGYSYDNFGRPILPNSSNSITVSHAKAMVAVGVSNGISIGIDIESVNRNFLYVAKKYLTKKESACVNENDKRQMALIWCVKEAVYKLPWKENSKVFSSDIEVKINSNTIQQGWCYVEIKELGEWVKLKANFTFFDEYCLVWVLKIVE